MLSHSGASSTDGNITGRKIKGLTSTGPPKPAAGPSLAASWPPRHLEGSWGAAQCPRLGLATQRCSIRVEKDQERSRGSLGTHEELISRPPGAVPWSPTGIFAGK